MSMPVLMLIDIIFPALLGAMLFIMQKNSKAVNVIVFLGALINLAVAFSFIGKEAVFSSNWVGFGLDFSLRLYNLSVYILLPASVIVFLVVVYSIVFLRGKGYAKSFCAYILLTVALFNGAVLADNLAVMLFFWEGILVTMFTMIALGGKKSYKTSVKAIIIVGFTDLCLMLGIGVTAWLSKTFAMTSIHLSLTSWGIFAFIFMMIGAIGKAGAMPFHTWIPNAADDAPLPFMALLPGSLEKLLGVYFLYRICVNFFDFRPGSGLSLVLMIIGAATILFAVMMALIQKDYKRLLSYHAVSQVGYMILGIGTALPVGVIGGLYHMVNHTLYKSCLFLTAGSVERQTGTTDLHKLGGLGRKMPGTFACFIVAALSIAGFPMTNGFFSKEMIFDGALESGIVFYIVALAGAFFTAVSFLKLGHTAFMGKTTETTDKVKEAPAAMLIPMIFLSLLCLALGFGKQLIVGNVLQPILKNGDVGGTNFILICISVIVLALAFLDHWLGYKKEGSSLKAADHFHYAPGLRSVYNAAEKSFFDPYYIGTFAIRGFSRAMLAVNNAISWFYDTCLVWLIGKASVGIRKAHNGNQAVYVVWVLVGLALVTVIFLI